MQRAWDEVVRFVNAPGARHKKQGFLLVETTTSSRVNGLIDEVIELARAPHDLKEMADVAAILFHHVQAEGYSMDQFQDSIIEKLNERLEVPH